MNLTEVRNKHLLIFNLEYNGYRFGWSPYNDKTMDQPHHPTEKVFIVSEMTGKIRDFMYIEYIEFFSQNPNYVK